MLFSDENASTKHSVARYINSYLMTQYHLFIRKASGNRIGPLISHGRMVGDLLSSIARTGDQDRRSNAEYILILILIIYSAYIL